MSPVFLWHKTFIVDTNTPVGRLTDPRRPHCGGTGALMSRWSQHTESEILCKSEDAREES